MTEFMIISIHLADKMLPTCAAVRFIYYDMIKCYSAQSWLENIPMHLLSKFSGAAAANKKQVLFV